MKNFPFQYEGKTYWYSRACVVGMFAYCKDEDGDWCILANRRGTGCPNNVGKWNVPGGFLDYDEQLVEAAIRECKEETGVIVPLERVKPFAVRSYPTGNQNVSNPFYVKLPGKTTDYTFSTAFMEPNEVMDIQWVKIEDLDMYNWAFNHRTRIQYIYDTVINPKSKRLKLILKLSELLNFTPIFD